jgi:hypothetical protein
MTHQAVFGDSTISRRPSQIPVAEFREAAFAKGTKPPFTIAALQRSSLSFF